MKFDLKNVFGFVPFVLAIILTSGCVTTSGAKESPPLFETNSVEILMKGRVIIQGVEGYHYREDVPNAVVEYENKLYHCQVWSELDGGYIVGKFVGCREIEDPKE